MAEASEKNIRFCRTGDHHAPSDRGGDGLQGKINHSRAFRALQAASNAISEVG